jgi:hypothetical protein
MGKYPPHLANLKHVTGVAWHAKEGVLEVTTPHALARAVGYIKYAGNAQGPVLFRGQNQLYPTMLPALFRGVKNAGPMYNRIGALKKYVQDVKAAGAFLGNTPEYTFEAILQHYGIRTRWLDLVDNFWTALWFACQQARSTGKLGEYLHFSPSSTEFAYVVLLQGGPERLDPKRPGVAVSDQTTIIDLRRAAPSTFLRPHAQHAMLMCRNSYDSGPESMNLAAFVVGIIRVKTALARSWLGTGELTSTHHVFPPPVYDDGYHSLLRSAPQGNDIVGAIQHIGA